jgi:hypothetical protein
MSEFLSRGICFSPDTGKADGPNEPAAEEDAEQESEGAPKKKGPQFVVAKDLIDDRGRHPEVPWSIQRDAVKGSARRK